MVQEEIRFGYALMIHAAVCVARMLAQTRSHIAVLAFTFLSMVQLAVVDSCASGVSCKYDTVSIYGGALSENDYPRIEPHFLRPPGGVHRLLGTRPGVGGARQRRGLPGARLPARGSRDLGLETCDRQN